MPFMPEVGPSALAERAAVPGFHRSEVLTTRFALRQRRFSPDTSDASDDVGWHTGLLGRPIGARRDRIRLWAPPCCHSHTRTPPPRAQVRTSCCPWRLRE